MSVAVDTSVLQDFASLVTLENLSLNSFLKGLLLKLTRQIPAELACVALTEDVQNERWIIVRDAEDYVVGADLGEFVRYVNRLRVGGEELPLEDRSFMGLVAHTGRIRRTGDVGAEACYRTSNGAVHSELAAPVKFQGQVLGVLNLESKRRDAFTLDNEHTIEQIAQLIALPLYGLLIEEGIRRPNIAVLEELAHHFSVIPRGVPIFAKNALDDVAQCIAGLFESQLCRVAIFRDGHIKIIGETRVPNPLWVDGADALARRAIDGKCAVREPQPSGYAEGKVPSMPPMMAAPMYIFGEVIGSLVVGCRKRTAERARQTYLGSDLQLLSMIQSHIAAHLRAKELEIIRREQAEERSRKASAISRIFVEPDLDTVLRKTVLKIPSLCDTLYCSVFLWQPEKKVLLLAASTGLPAELLNVASYSLGEGLTGWVAKHGKPLFLDSRGPEALAKIAPDLGWKSKYDEAGSPPNSPFHPFAAVPIFLNGEVKGVLRLSGRHNGSFGEEDEFLLTLVAAKIATAIEHTDTYQRRIRLLGGLRRVIRYSRGLNVNAIGEFLKNSAAAATEAFDADLVLIYQVTNGAVIGPPVWSGEVRDKTRMEGKLSSGSVPLTLLVDGTSKYWPDV